MEYFIKNRTRQSYHGFWNALNSSYNNQIFILSFSSICNASNPNEVQRFSRTFSQVLSVVQANRQDINLVSARSSQSALWKFLCPLSHKISAVSLLPTVAAASTEAQYESSTPAKDPEAGTPGISSWTNRWTSLFKTKSDEKTVALTPVSLYDPPSGETARKRILSMYTTDEYGRLGPEWSLIIQGFWGSMIVGGLIGFFVGGKHAAIQFQDRNEATKFLNEMDAKRKMQDKVTLGIMRGMFEWGWRITLFTTMYLFLASHFSVLRGRTNVLDFAAAGAVTGGLWRFLQGPRAALVAGGLGGVLGLVTGTIGLGTLKLSGSSLEEMRYWHYHSTTMKIKGEVANTKQEKDSLLSSHDSLVMSKLQDGN